MSTIKVRVAGTTFPSPLNEVQTITTSYEGYPIQVQLPTQLISIRTTNPTVHVHVSPPVPEITINPSPPTPVINVEVSGAPGPRGPQGLPGEGGGPGGSDVDVYRIDQPTPMKTWHIDIGRVIGALRVIDSAGTEVEPGDIRVSGPSPTAVDLLFSAAFSGTVYVTG